MATITELAKRVLRKLTVLAPGEPGDAHDLEVAVEKLKAVHASLKKEELLQWTLQDIPDWAEEPYITMAAFLLGPEFTKPVDIGMWQYGMSEIRSGVQIGNGGTVCAEYF